MTEAPSAAIARLHKEATQKRGHDLAGAITCLQEAQALMESEGTGHVQQWLRLPNFLLDARRFDEAMACLEALRNNTPTARAITAGKAKGFNYSLSKDGLNMLMHADLQEIYSTMTVAAAWSGDEASAELYQQKADFHEAKWAALNQIT